MEVGFFFPEPRDFVTHVTLVQRNGQRDWRDLMRNKSETHVRFWVFGVEDTDMQDDELQVYFKWTLCSIDLLLFSEMHIRQKFQWTSEQLSKVCVPWFAIRSIEGYPNFLQSIFLCCWIDLLPFYPHYSFCRVFWSAAFIAFGVRERNP